MNKVRNSDRLRRAMDRLLRYFKSLSTNMGFPNMVMPEFLPMLWSWQKKKGKRTGSLRTKGVCNVQHRNDGEN